MTIKDLLTQYITNNTVMQLATVSEGIPQLCTVHYAVDEDCNFYWLSSRSTHHSQSLEVTSNAAIGVLHSIEQRQCVHSQGHAERVTGDKVQKAHECYCKRFGENPKNLQHALSDDEKGFAYYVYKPIHLVLFDPVNFPENPRQEFPIISS